MNIIIALFRGSKIYWYWRKSI